ncbi:SDR family oxidoreductase, partial [Kibdelosporangium lantanae]
MITGSCGQLGAHVMRGLVDRGITVLGLSRRPCTGSHGPVRVLDVRSPELTNVIREFQPTHIVHLAGVSSPTEAERDPDRAWAMHVDVPRRLNACGVWMLYPSSDFVWDGTKKGRYTTADVPHPQSVYGRSKVAGERVVDGLVVRFSLLYGPPACPRSTTWTQWTSKIDAGEPVPVFTNEFRTPLPFTEAAERVIDLGRHKVRGLVHVAGPDVLTPKDLVTVLARSRGT